MAKNVKMLKVTNWRKDEGTERLEIGTMVNVSNDTANRWVIKNIAEIIEDAEDLIDITPELKLTWKQLAKRCQELKIFTIGDSQDDLLKKFREHLAKESKKEEIKKGDLNGGKYNSFNVN